MAVSTYQLCAERSLLVELEARAARAGVSLDRQAHWIKRHCKVVYVQRLQVEGGCSKPCMACAQALAMYGIRVQFVDANGVVTRMHARDVQSTKKCQADL